MLIGLAIFTIGFGRMEVKQEATPMAEKLMGPNFQALIDSTAKSRETFLKLPYEELTVTSDDGKKLKGYFFKNEKETDKTAILIHGYDSTGFIDFATVGLRYLNHGYNILLTENRACGKSEGHFTGFGVLESKDSMLWVDYLVKRFPKGDIFIEGCSLGGATANMMNDFDLPENVRCIISDCSFLEVWSELAHMFKYMAHLPAFPLLYTTQFWAKKIMHYDFKTRSPIKSVAHAKKPTLFIHGSEDRYIPVENAEKLYAACTSEKELVIIDGAGHAASHSKDPEKFDNAVFSFIKKYETK